MAQCPTAAKSEAIMEFHPNEDVPVQLCELRLHKPISADADEDGEDQVEVGYNFLNFFVWCLEKVKKNILWT